jgi:hypothetical protein
LAKKNGKVWENPGMGLMLHRQDGTVAEWRGGRLRLPVRAVTQDRRRRYVPGDVVSLWNKAAYEEWLDSPQGLADVREWQREMLSRVDEA